MNGSIIGREEMKFDGIIARAGSAGLFSCLLLSSNQRGVIHLRECERS